jgi:tetratricopeptide (TPR) repeat protein
MTQRFVRLSLLAVAALVGSPWATTQAFAQAPAAGAEEANSAVRGSLVEDRAARKLLEAGDARFDADETKEALEIWKSVVERYPKSRLRFQALMRLGNYYLERDRAYDRARAFFESVVIEENQDEEQRAEATLKIGICFYESRIFGKCFQVMREVIEKYPVSFQVNEAYHYIGLAHFQLGHYSRAIESLEKVGTALDSEEGKAEKLEAGKRMFVKIDDADLAALEIGEIVKVRIESTSGDSEEMSCYPVGRNVRVVLGTLPTDLGRPKKDNGTLEIKGDDKVKVFYVDNHTADKQVDQEVLKEIGVVGNANVRITDGAYSETLLGVVLGKPVNVQITDADRDLVDDADSLNALIEVYRAKTDEELDAEVAAAAAKKTAEGAPAVVVEDAPIDKEEDEVQRFKLIDKVALNLVEAKIAKQETQATKAMREATEDPTAEGAEAAPAAEGAPAKEEGKPADEKAAPAEKAKPAPESAKPAPAKAKPAAEKSEEAAKTASDEAAAPAAEKPAAEEGTPAAEAAPAEVAPMEVDNSIHSGVFRGTITLVRAEEIVADDAILQALPGDVIRVTYIDEINSGEGLRQLVTKVRCIEGDLGSPKITRALITDEELRLQTKLKTAAALTNIGNRYKEFGLKANADDKYKLALTECDGIMTEAAKLGGRVLEETYVQLWRIYFEMDQLNLAAAMAYRLQREFPTSGFVDEALLQLGNVARKQGDVQRAIGIYSQLVGMKTSKLRGEAQFGIAECYEQMAEAATEAAAPPLFDRAFQEYKKVFEQFADSGRVGEAVSKMANYYYKQKDYSRAVDTFETVLNDHPDAKFLDVVLFNYGRCLYRMGNKAEARAKFDQLIGDYPSSPLAPDAKKIAEALNKPSAG